MRLRWSDRILRTIGFVVTGVTVLVILSPVVLTVILSFADDPNVVFPPQSWGFDRYVRLAQSEFWLTALWLSVRLALASAVLAIVVGLLGLIAVHRTKLPFRGWLEQASIVPLILPISAYAVAMYGVFADLQLLGSFLGIMLSHVIIAVPFVVLIVGSALRNVPIELELVAITLGARRVRAWVGITLRLMIPAIVGGFIMAFQRSFEEAVFISFLGGPGLVTLPKAIFDSVQWGYDPIITAIAAIMVIVASVVVAIPMARGRERK